MASVNHDEYTDYSCSTSVERLARDVETELRSWHLGSSDRHVSFFGYFQPNSGGNNKRHSFLMDSGTRSRLASLVRDDGRKKMDGRGGLVRAKTVGGGSSGSLSTMQSNPGRKKNRMRMAETEPRAMDDNESFFRKMAYPRGRPDAASADDATMEASTAPDPKDHYLDPSNTPIHLIRSADICWNVSLSDGTKIAVPLVLALWDGPSDQKLDPTATGKLPQSLKRLTLRAMPTDPFANLSTLFGIGQHLTLSLAKNASPANIANDVEWAMGRSVVERHDEKLMAPWIVTSSLSHMLQTAMQCAISNVSCRIPAFGIWGIYRPDEDFILRKSQEWMPQRTTRVSGGLYPSWLAPCVGGLPTRKRTGIFDRSDHINHSYIPPIVTSDLMGGVKFWVNVLPSRDSSNRLTVWGRLLLQHSSTPNVILCGAKHVYTWRKSATVLPQTSLLLGGQSLQKIDEWRQNLVVEVDNDDATPGEVIEKYRTQCCQYAVSLLEQALGASSSKPMWGPPDDPVHAVRVTVTWNGKRGDDNSPESLLTMPLRIRSRRAMSRRDWVDMEESVERTILDPLAPSLFMVQTNYDRDVALTPLAAVQRCLLASLIRAATLPHTLLPQQLTDEAVVDSWNSEATEAAVNYLIDHAKVSKVTKQMAQAMDWAHIADDMIESWEAQYIVQKAVDASLGKGFPAPPEPMPREQQSRAFDSLPKSAPPGRLLSVLFWEMSKLKTPSSMAIVWTSFVAELRDRWDTRESLPNMMSVPGLDPPPKARRNRANHAAFLDCAEPDPDDEYCLIGQKIRVFNIGIELALAQEARFGRQQEQQQWEHYQRQQQFDGHDTGDAACGVSVASTELMNNTAPPDASGVTSISPSLSARDLGDDEVLMDKKEPIGKYVDKVVDSYPPETEDMGEKSQASSTTSSKLEFYDAESGGPDVDESDLAGVRELPTNVTMRQHRKGARCPVHGMSLIASGDQLYAPYLQRPYPLTDDVMLERRIMLTRQEKLGSDQTTTTQFRIEIAHRLQKPNLLSDMRAFKAANPGAIFQDFIAWYGNPGSPLEEYYNFVREMDATNNTTSSGIGERLDKAAEAIQVLNSTKEFWSDVWDEATACAAVEQDPLFDVSSTVEMVLDCLETLHPASLLNQIVAVNLSMSYFVLLASAGDAVLVGVVSQSLERLRKRTDEALKLLSRDVVCGSVAHEEFSRNPEHLPRHASVQAIRACDGVCDALSDAETTLARAVSLLHKFPRRYDLVHNILRRADNDSISLTTPTGRSSILDAVRRQQHQTERLPKPSMREYVLRNTDEASPCQLCVRFGEKEDDHDGGLLIALTKTQGDNLE